MKLIYASLFFAALLAATAHGDLEQRFLNPPDKAKPWVYWFPLDGNLTREGITADLEAMARVGIGGVLYMETAQGTPTGPAAVWRAALARTVQARLRAKPTDLA